MQSVSSRIWTRVVVSISYDGNHYTTGTSTTDPMIVTIKKKRERICRIENVAVSADPWLKRKESQKWDKYVDLTRELKAVEHVSNADIKTW